VAEASEFLQSSWSGPGAHPISCSVNTGLFTRG